jgi:hypothetical protein
LREHALRSTADYFPEYLVLSIGLGPLVDRPSTVWQETFMPEQLREAIRTVVVERSPGETRPLIASEHVVLPEWDPRPARPPRWAGRFFAAGAIVGSVLFGLGQLSRRRHGFAVAFSCLIALLGTVAGLLGVALLSLWAFTDHVVTYRNQNSLLLSPVALALVFYALRIVRRGGGAVAQLKWPALLLVLSSALALVLKVLPFEWQDNTSLIAFFVPCWIGLWLASVQPSLDGFRARRETRARGSVA